MILAKLFTKIFKKSGIILIDSENQKYICGSPRQIKPITLKLLKKDLNWKILLNPELEFPEGYMRGDIIIENASLKEFLMEVLKNLGRSEVSTASIFFKKVYQASHHKEFHLFFHQYHNGLQHSFLIYLEN